MKIEDKQREQYQDFTMSWDEYMEDYERAAYESVRFLRQSQEDAQEQLK